MNNGSDHEKLVTKLVELLRASDILNELSNKQIGNLANRATFEKQQVGDVLVKKGDPSHGFYFILEGQVQIIDELDGEPWVEGYLFEGDFGGEFGLLTDGPEPVTEEVVVDAVLARFDEKTFDWLVKTGSSVSKKLQIREAFIKGQTQTAFEGQRYSEAVVVHTKRHFVAFLSNLPGSIILIILSITIGFVLFNTLGSSGYLLISALSGCFMILGLVSMTYLYLDWRNDDFIITTERAIHIERILLHGEVRQEAPLTSIQDVSVNMPSLFAKMFDYSDLQIQTAGAGPLIFDGVKSADRLRAELFLQREKAQERVEASDTRALRGSLKEIMTEDISIEPFSSETTEPKRAKSSRRKLPPIINFFVPRVQEVDGDVITWRKNYFVFLRLVIGPLLAGLALLYLTLAALIGFFPFGVANTPLALIFLIGWPFILLWYTFRYDIWRKDEYLVTRTAIIDYKGSAFNLQGEQRRIGTFDVIQNSTFLTPNFIAKLLNIGHVVIETAGTEMTFTFAWVYNPAAVQQEVFKRWLAYKDFLASQDRAYEEQRLKSWLGEFYAMLPLHDAEDRPQEEAVSESS